MPPQALKLLVNHVGNAEEEAWKGFLYAGLMFASSAVWTVLFHMFCHVALKIG